jgi:hypothetical protein
MLSSSATDTNILSQTFQFDVDECCFSISGPEDEVKKHFRQLLYSNLIKKKYGIKKTEFTSTAGEYVQYDLLIPTRHRSDLRHVVAYFKQEFNMPLDTLYIDTNICSAIKDDEGGLSDSLYAYFTFFVFNSLENIKLEIKDVGTAARVDLWPKEALATLRDTQINDIAEYQNKKLREEQAKNEERAYRATPLGFLSSILFWQPAIPAPLLKNQALAEALIPVFHSPYGMFEIDRIFDLARKLLTDLTFKTESIEQEIDKIIVGTLVIARAVFQIEYPRNNYDGKTFHEISQAAGMLTNRMNDKQMGDFILKVGEEALLNHSLSFDKKYVHNILPNVAKLLADDRFDAYHLNEDVVKQVQKRGL